MFVCEDHILPSLQEVSLGLTTPCGGTDVIPFIPVDYLSQDV